MPQLPSLVVRSIAGLAALACCAGVFVYGMTVIMLIAWGEPSAWIFEVRMTPLSSAVVCIACFVLAVALTAQAIRGESTRPEEESARDRA